MFKCEELNKLQEYLVNNKIEHSDLSEYDIIVIERIRYKLFDNEYSCICGLGTYGNEEGLIEFYDFKNNPVGYLHADDIIKKIENEKRRMA